MERLFFFLGALFCGLSVAIGAAFGHIGSTPLGDMQLIWIAKATRYQFNHGLALLVIACAMMLSPTSQRLLTMVGYCFTAGIVLFSGSLYFMTFTSLPAGYITPLGGFAFLAGWLLSAWGGLKLSR